MKTVDIKIDEKIKNQAMKIFDEHNLSIDEAIQLFLQQVVLTQSIPFLLKIPNAETVDQDLQFQNDFDENEWTW